MKHDDCLFCKLVSGELPSAKVYEDEHVFAFTDISQVTKGHTLVVPKVHTRDIYSTSDEIAGNLFAAIPKISRAIKKTYHPVGLNLLNNNEILAGQTVFHFHMHIIPRYDKTDGFGALWETRNDLFTMTDLQKIAQDIQTNIEE